MDPLVHGVGSEDMLVVPMGSLLNVQRRTT